MANYTHKGSLVSLSGSIQTGSYTDKQGNKKYTTDVIADEVNFLDKKEDNQGTTSQEDKDIKEITPVDDSDIPF